MGQRGIPTIKTKNMNGTTNWGYCDAVTLYFLGKSVECVSSRLQEDVQNVGASAEI
jgi:hypothetical protein